MVFMAVQLPTELPRRHGSETRVRLHDVRRANSTTKTQRDPMFRLAPLRLRVPRVVLAGDRARKARDDARLPRWIGNGPGGASMLGHGWSQRGVSAVGGQSHAVSPRSPMI